MLSDENNIEANLKSAKRQHELGMLANRSLGQASDTCRVYTSLTKGLLTEVGEAKRMMESGRVYVPRPNSAAKNFFAELPTEPLAKHWWMCINGK